jgi:hypothetical protein
MEVAGGGGEEGASSSAASGSVGKAVEGAAALLSLAVAAAGRPPVALGIRVGTTKAATVATCRVEIAVSVCRRRSM